MAAVWERSAHSGSELLMLLAIADFSDDDGRAYPSVSTLAAKCRTAPRYAMKLLEALSASGELEIRKNQGPMGRGGRTNLYRVAVERMRAAGDKAVNQSSGVQAAEVMNSGAVVNQSSGVNPGARSGEPGFREVVNQRSPKPSGNRQEPERARAARSAASTRGSRLSSDWTPTAADLTFCREQRPDLDPRIVADDFRDYWTAKTGAGATKLDWSATWRTWVRKERPPVGAAAPIRRPVLAADDLFTGASA
jgi:hypothetical protein